MSVGDVSKRILLGRKLSNRQLGETLLPKRIALPVFASDALSSVAYAPDEILLTLSIAGASAFLFSPWIALAVVVVMLSQSSSDRGDLSQFEGQAVGWYLATLACWLTPSRRR